MEGGLAISLSSRGGRRNATRPSNRENRRSAILARHRAAAATKGWKIAACCRGIRSVADTLSERWTARYASRLRSGHLAMMSEIDGVRSVVRLASGGIEGQGVGTRGAMPDQSKPDVCRSQSASVVGGTPQVERDNSMVSMRPRFERSIMSSHGQQRMAGDWPNPISRARW